MEKSLISSKWQLSNRLLMKRFPTNSYDSNIPMTPHFRYVSLY